MQAQVGLFPSSGAPPPPQIIFPGQFAAMIAAQGNQMLNGGGMFPTNTYTPGFGASPLFQGPTGFITPMSPGAPFNPYAPASPYANMMPYGSPMGRPSPFAAYAPSPPPAYAGLQGLGAAPYAPPPIMPSFDTPYGSRVAQAQANQMRGWSLGQANMGSAIHAGTTLGMAAIGGMMGGPIGAAGGALLSESMGLGRGAQNLYGSYVSAPRLAIQGAAQGLEHLSQSFVHSGTNLHPSGAGFSHHAALEAAQGLSNMANSSAFRRETFDRFNQQDVFKITQSSAENGLLSGTTSPQNLTARVREIAKSVSAFMELAREPDIQRAIQTMGSLRNSGLNLQETMSAVASGRAFARMAGTSFQGLSEIGGALGSQMYQSMGLSQGLGVQVGMGAYGQAASSINQGTLTPQVSSLVGGREGLAMLNSTFSASQLQLPMTAMGLMGPGGGLSGGAVQSYLRGGTDVFGLTSRGAGTLGGIAGRLGVGGMGMAIGMQPMIQDSVGRLIEQQGPFARRNLEDRSIMNLSRQMGMSGAEGFMTAAQISGMQGTAALARLNELQSSTYWETQQDQMRTEQREARANSDRNRRVRAPRTIDTLLRNTALGSIGGSIGHALHHAEVGLSRAFGGEETMGVDSSPTTEAGRRRLSETVRSSEFREYLDGMSEGARGLPGGVSGVGYGTNLAWAGGSRGALAALDGLFMGSDAFRNRAARDYTAGGEYASSMLSTTSAEQRRAMGRVNETFGSMEGLSQFSQAASELARNANGTGRVALGNLTGLVGSRAIAGSSLERAFRDTLRRQGVGDTEISRRWQSERSTITAQHSVMRRMYGETDAEREAWETTGEGATRFGQEGAPMQRMRDNAQAGYRRLMGDVGSEGQAAFRTISDEAEGLGPEGSKRNRLTRQLATGMALAQIGNMQRDGSLRDSGIQSINRMVAQAEREGVSREDIAAISERASGISRRHLNTDGAQEAARGFITRGSGLSDIGETEQARMMDVGGRRVLAGFAGLASAGGSLGDAFRGLNASNFSQERLRGIANQLSRDDLRRLRQQRGGEGYASALERIRNGDQRGFQDIYSRAERDGRDSERLENEYNTTDGLGRGAGAWFRRMIGSEDNARSRWVAEQLRTSSPEEREARMRRGESADAEGTVRGAGIGRAGDALLEASRELNEVTRNLREVSNGNSISALVGRPM